MNAVEMSEDFGPCSSFRGFILWRNSAREAMPPVGPSTSVNIREHTGKRRSEYNQKDAPQPKEKTRPRHLRMCNEEEPRNYYHEKTSCDRSPLVT